METKERKSLKKTIKIEQEIRDNQIEKPSHFHRYKYIYLALSILILVVLIIGLTADTSHVNNVNVPTYGRDQVVSNIDSNSTYDNVTGAANDLADASVTLFQTVLPWLVVFGVLGIFWNFIRPIFMGDDD